MLRWFPRLQVATACFSCSPPDLNFLDPYFIFMYMHYNHYHYIIFNYIILYIFWWSFPFHGIPLLIIHACPPFRTTFFKFFLCVRTEIQKSLYLCMTWKKLWIMWKLLHIKTKKKFSFFYRLEVTWKIAVNEKSEMMPRVYVSTGTYIGKQGIQWC